MPSFTVLVTDDELAIRQVVIRALQEQGVSAVEAADGAEALEIARATRPDLILLDIEMPSMDGRDVLLALRRDDRTREIPILFLTGRTDHLSRLHGLELGAHDYLEKPFTASQVAIQVHRLLKKFQDEAAPKSSILPAAEG